MKLLDGKTALITGGSRGIGESIARKFASHGSNVAFTYRSSAEKAKLLEDELKSQGVNAKGYQSDAGSYSEAEELIKQIGEDFGDINTLVNNAGITKDQLLLRMSEEDFDQVIAVNLKSVYNLTKHIARPMMKQRAGSIINMSSIVGIRGQAGQSNYAASKAGIIGFTQKYSTRIG